MEPQSSRAKRGVGLLRPVGGQRSHGTRATGTRLTRPACRRCACVNRSSLPVSGEAGLRFRVIFPPSHSKGERARGATVDDGTGAGGRGSGSRPFSRTGGTMTTPRVRLLVPLLAVACSLAGAG